MNSFSEVTATSLLWEFGGSIEKTVTRWQPVSEKGYWEDFLSHKELSAVISPIGSSFDF